MFSLHTLLLIVERFEGNYFFFGCFVVGLPLKKELERLQRDRDIRFTLI